MTEDRARQGVEHLQAAAVEVIAAFRAFLDVAEEVVRDPSGLTAIATSLVETAKAAAPSPSAPPGAAGDEGSGEPPRVTRIRVS